MSNDATADHPPNVFRCRSGDGTEVMICADIEDGSPALLFRREGVTIWLQFTADDADAMANALNARAIQYREAIDANR